MIVKENLCDFPFIRNRKRIVTTKLKLRFSLYSLLYLHINVTIFFIADVLFRINYFECTEVR